VTSWARHPLKDGRAPAWAVAWGEDRYGAFAAFAVGPPGQKNVEQRMRWIPPGTFQMGSPKTELGRYRDEGPQHKVILTRGYWLGETPVTQALWIVVMGENPSGFRSERPDYQDLPVENVSWDDCQVFIGRLNAQVAGLVPRLPTEAEWERACRGETHSATWVGELSGKAASPELDVIAWYGNNSGGKPHPVGHKAPNPYGLHDMLGNVYEWCADAAKDNGTPYPYTTEAVTDPVISSSGSGRIRRGGAWNSSARRLRAAYRLANARDYRYVSLGFRLAAG